jgi:L-rhamnonate dehydratase
MTNAPIARVETIALAAPPADPDDLDASRETLVIAITDTEGRTGIGEADAPARVVRELVEMDDLFAWSRGLANVLRGRDPFCRRALYADLNAATLYHGRRGLGIHALSGVDVALHDLAARQLGRPVYELLGGTRREAITPYATIWPGAVKGRTIDAMMATIGEQVATALAMGFRALKVEVVFGDLVGDRELAECIHEARRLAGADTMLAIDFGYRWGDWRDAQRLLDRCVGDDIYFAEACIQHDDVAGHAKLAARAAIRIGAAEFAATVHECREWLQAGVDVLQPDVARCGGLTEIARIAELASHHGAVVIPHGWKTGITAAAQRHFQAATPNCPYVEMSVPALWPSPLRAELVGPEPVVVDGRIELPTAAGLGVELRAETVDRYRLA